MAHEKQTTIEQPTQEVVTHTYPDVDTSGSINEPPGSNTMPVEEGYVEPVPTITGMDPQECAIGDPDFVLMISGDNLHGSTVINFAGHDEPTTMNEDGTISTGVKPSLWADAVVVPVLVRNGGVASEPMQFTFSEAGAARKGKRAEPEDDDDEDKPANKRRRR